MYPARDSTFRFRFDPSDITYSVSRSCRPVPVARLSSRPERERERDLFFFFKGERSSSLFLKKKKNKQTNKGKKKFRWWIFFFSDGLRKTVCKLQIVFLELTENKIGKKKIQTV
jgi:hypothetical protein